MKITKLISFIFVFIWAVPNAFASVPEENCGGVSTLIYSGSEIDLSICHGEYTKIDQSKLGQWQNCDDAIVQIKDKKNGKLSIYADCQTNKIRQFMIADNALELSHVYVEYPGFEEKPLLIERFDLTTHTKKYIFKKQFLACNKIDVDNSVKQIESGIANRSDMGKYFDSVYGGLFKLRDCAKTAPVSVLAVFKKYEKKALFDGEVAETFSELFEEVKLISTAMAR